MAVQCSPVQCGLGRVMMSTVIDPHLIVLCISKAGQHLRTTVWGADLSAQPGLKLPSGNPSNSSYVHSHIWKGGRTCGPWGFACDVGQEERDSAPFYQDKPFKENPSHDILYCTDRYHQEHVDTDLIFCIVTLKLFFFKTSVQSTVRYWLHYMNI